MFVTKEAWDQVSSQENQNFNPTIVNGHPLPL